MQTKDDGKHAILPVAKPSDRARVPVTMSRDSDGKMRLGGSNAARMQPHLPVDERGRLHGAPELDPKAEQRIAAKIRVEFSNAKEKRRCRKSVLTATRLRRQDKATLRSPLAALASVCLHIGFSTSKRFCLEVCG